MSPTFVTIVLIISLVLVAVPFVIVTVLKVGIFTNTEFQGPESIRLKASQNAALGNITRHLSLSRNVTFGASSGKDKDRRPSHASAQKQTYLRSVDGTADSKDVIHNNASSMKKGSETATHNKTVTNTFQSAVIIPKKAAMRSGSGVENKTQDISSSKENFAETATANVTDLKIERSKYADPTNPAYKSAINNSSPAPEVCGQLSQGPRRHRRIVGGSDASRKQFPWVVMVLVNGRFWCAGSIIHPRHILTAAHCVRKRGSGQHGNERLLYFDAAEVEVIAGKYTYDVTSKHDDVTGEQRVPVDAVIPHPHYDDTKSVAKHNDIALLVLRTPLRWTSTVSRICLPSKHDHLPRTATFAGWGSVKSRGFRHSL
ncbi:ovochymase-1-like [Littorina saxatilis]|uniref:Peptidase S1 domain-containing protein n=1 Tax=Littorina saxatilis TaxID=31220 RepID=A0AAN9BRF9_9CAEN